jgi:ubiquinone biosynthesis protein
MNIITPSQNTPDLKEDIDDLLHLYYGAELKNMDGAMEDLLKVMVKNEVILPREFVMIGRGIALIEDTGKKLDPEFNAATELKQLARNIVINKYKPKRLTNVGINYLLQLEHLAKDLPDTINNTISKLEEGNIEVNLSHNGISELANQLSVSLILSALIMGSSLALLTDVGPTLFDIPLLGLVGFVFSAILGGFLVIEYMLERD